MMKNIFVLLLVFSNVLLFSQTKMKTTEELINDTDSGWKFVSDWIKSAKNKVEILPVERQKAIDVLYKTQVTTRSPMGAIIYETGGILVDNGWIRILGSGSEKLTRNIAGWNLGKAFNEFGKGAPYLLIGDDAIGGFFILNGGIFGEDVGKIYYFAPDTLEYEPLDITYSQFLDFCFNNNLNDFYKGFRWKKWKEDVSELNADSVYNFYPYLWTKEGKNIEKISKKVISIDEQYGMNISLRKQIGIEK